MAIYKTGQASVSADGVVTGYGTKWKDALSLIRKGCTIAFATSPTTFATISDIRTDTEMTVTDAPGVEIPRGDYVILLTTSITVDGLAQDVAETLRYYQGRETQYEQFVEFLENFDWEKFETVTQDVKANADAAQASADAAKTSETKAAASASAAKTSEMNAANSAASIGNAERNAAASAAAAKTSETNAAASSSAAAGSASAAKTSETNAKTSETNSASSATAANNSKNAAATSATNAAGSATSASNSASAAKTSETNAASSASSAKTSETNAAASASAAAGSATTAKNEADRAKSLADSLDTSKLMMKANNLSDVASKAVSLQNLLDGKPLPLAAEAVGDFDAVTLRQLKASSGGGGGASMNGVMNNFIGAVEWFNGSRASLPAGYVAADGQLINRSDAPDLWAAVSSGFLTATKTDAIWIASGNAEAPAMNRGMYSPGDGSTTFRVPDLNGIQPGSVRSPFLRGAASGDVVGRILQDSAPNISGTFTTPRATSSFVGPMIMEQSGVFSQTGSVMSQVKNLSNVGSMESVSGGVGAYTSFDARRSNTSYGRDGSDEVHPNEVFGIWIIRSSGAFQSANNSFDVINSYATQPGSGVLMRGGDVRSTIKVAGQVKVTASLNSFQRVGNDAMIAGITLTDGAKTRVYTLPQVDSDVDLLSTNSPQGAFAWCRFSNDVITSAFNITSITREAAGAYKLYYQNQPSDSTNQSIVATAIQGTGDVKPISASIYSIAKDSFSVATMNDTGRIDASLMVTVHRK